ncbi:MAG TPA: hypothetical protein VGI35_10005, partial [Steroidobacteraceae bacterium]
MSETDSPRPGEGLIQTPATARESLERVLRASDFIGHTLAREPALLDELIASGDLLRGGAETAASYYAARTPRWSPGQPLEETEFMARLRRWRRREMVRIAYRDLAGWATLAETLAELTAFADHAIDAAYAYARARLTAIHGEPRAASGGTQPLLTIAMGKLGGRELNFSSDIDLVFLFPEHGDTDALGSGESPARSISNEEFFTRLGQGLLRLLGARTEDGFVFRVDLRLRPFGESGPLAASFASFEDYMQRHGRDWERYAWIKARPITGRECYAELYASAVRPFVYRRYLDYGVFESLREMKGLIEREVAR